MQETGKENAKAGQKNNKKKWMILAVCAFAAAILLIGFIGEHGGWKKKAEQEYLAMQEKKCREETESSGRGKEDRYPGRF